MYHQLAAIAGNHPWSVRRASKARAPTTSTTTWRTGGATGRRAARPRRRRGRRGSSSSGMGGLIRGHTSRRASSSTTSASYRPPRLEPCGRRRQSRSERFVLIHDVRKMFSYYDPHLPFYAFHASFQYCLSAMLGNFSIPLHCECGCHVSMVPSGPFTNDVS